MNRMSGSFFAVIVVLSLSLLPTACGTSDEAADQQPTSWPIAQEVYTTAEHQIQPLAVPPSAPQVNPSQVAEYAQYGYSAWQQGGPLAYVKRTELAPAYKGAANAARLLIFFSISDIHIADKESPAQVNYAGWSAPFGPSSAGLSSAYSAVILSSTHVLDAAVQTINALHKKTPFDFGISLGDTVNNCQYNELRWYIDVLDGQVITPSSGAHAGAETIDYQKPFKAVGLDKSIPWYQTIGNHDQFWMGTLFESEKTRNAHVGSEVLNTRLDKIPSADMMNHTGIYTGVVDGTTPYGDIVKAGPQENFSTPPTVVPDNLRHSLATATSTRLNWMKEFFTTTTHPSGHGFSQANLDRDFASYSFEPKSNLPLKVIVLDDTCNGSNEVNYAAGCLDKAREDWLKAELDEGQSQGKLMIISAHIPLLPQASLTDKTIVKVSLLNDGTLMSTLHTYPNLIMWISGHRHMNVVTPQPYNAQDLSDHPENSFWEVETASLRDFPQQLRTFDLRRNSDNTISIFVTDVDPAVAEGSPAAKSRGYAIGAARIFGATADVLQDTTSHAYNAELVKQLSSDMQAKIATLGSSL